MRWFASEYGFSLSCPCRQSALVSQCEVGANVRLDGTGKWHAGKQFRAVVVEKSRGSVKVRYMDGSYKRFAREEWWLSQRLRTKQHSQPETDMDVVRETDKLGDAKQVETELAGNTCQWKECVCVRA